MKFYRTKVQKISKPVISFGGIYFVNQEFKNIGLSELIDKEIGKRGKKGSYTYGKIIQTWMNIFLCGGECAEDIQDHLRTSLELIPGNEVPSADTLLRGIKELAVKNTTTVSASGKSYQFNIPDKLNNLNIKLLMLTGQLESGKEYDFDYDNQIIQHDKYDAKPAYKKTTGYFPGVATIGDKMQRLWLKNSSFSCCLTNNACIQLLPITEVNFTGINLLLNILTQTLFLLTLIPHGKED
jgi:hypothetical protein